MVRKFKSIEQKLKSRAGSGDILVNGELMDSKELFIITKGKLTENEIKYLNSTKFNLTKWWRYKNSIRGAVVKCEDKQIWS